MINQDQFLEYLAQKIPDFQKVVKRGQVLFSCPNQKNHKYQSKSPTMTVIPGSNKFYCLQCGIKVNQFDIIRLLEEDKKSYTDGQILEYLTNTMKITAYSELDEYKKYKFSLLPIAKNGKVPIEKDWTNKTHYEKSEWLQWIESGNNIGIRTGEVSGITAIDVDLKIAPTPELEEIYKELALAKTLKQNSPKGVHFIFKYDKDLKQTSKIAGVTIDIRNEGGQILCSPSKINNLNYNWVNLGNEIKEIPQILKDKLLVNKRQDDIIIESNRKQFEESGEGESTKLKKERIETIKMDEKGQIIKLKNDENDYCDDTFIRLGGIFLKNGLPSNQIEMVLNVFNTQLLERPLLSSAIKGKIQSLEGYKESEETTQERAIYECCQLLVVDICASEIEKHTNLKKNIVNKYLSKFHKEGKLVRKRLGRYDLKEKIEWTNEEQPELKEIDFEMPYFSNLAHFREGDIIILGAFSGKGKTTLSMNFINHFKKQNIIPYYISLESGSRAQITAEKLGLKQKDYYIPKKSKDFIVKPMHIELEENQVTIIDWLNLGEDFSATPMIFEHLSDEMRRKNGILIVFTQTREDGRWFAPDLITQFGRFCARFHITDTVGTYGCFEIDKMTEPIGQYLTYSLQTEFNFDTKELIIKS